jgi:hypothetical protein
MLADGARLSGRCRRLRTWGTSGAKLNLREDTAVDVLVERLDARLREWKPETAAHVRECVAEVIDLADQDVLDLMRPRATEQEVLDLLDEPTTR